MLPQGGDAELAERFAKYEEEKEQLTSGINQKEIELLQVKDENEELKRRVRRLSLAVWNKQQRTPYPG